MNLKPKTLYIRDNKGAIRQWSIGVEDYIIIIKHGQVGGRQQAITEEVESGKAGRSLEEQIQLRIASRINKQKDKGYSEDIKLTSNGPVNRIGLKKPMLAQAFGKVNNIDFSEAFVQHKYDGNRCLIANIGGKKVAYTRNGKIYKAIDHILDSISLSPSTIIDGELYCHGESLQTIVSWCKRDTPLPETKKLKYHCYDIISPNKFSERLAELYDSVQFGESAEIVPTIKIDSYDKLMEMFKESRRLNYEGSILRWGDFGYEDGKRSKSLVKIKEWLDSEFVVIGINPSKDYWAILTCAVESGKTFSVSAPGTITQKREVLMNREKYLGTRVKVQFSGFTKDGIPFHPVAICWE